MAFDFNNLTDNDNLIEPYLTEKLFSETCDALLFSTEKEKFPETVIRKASYIKNLGYYTAGFHMLHPFYYLGEEYNKNGQHIIKGGVLFIKISANANLDRLSVDDILPGATSDVIENLPIVVFRNYHGDICAKNDCKDLSLHFKCQNDTYDFVGVFTASKIENTYAMHYIGNSPRDYAYYKLTKVLDRFYFDNAKIENNC